MSDGPHRSLPMSRRWKKVAEYAERPAFSSDEIGEEIISAVAQDWQTTVPRALIDQIGAAFSRASLFSEDTAGQLERLGPTAAGHPFGCVFLECAIQAAAQGHSGERGLREAISKALTERATRCARQVEEHYLRNRQLRSAQPNVRLRMEDGIRKAEFDLLTERLLDSRRMVPRPKKRDGLDDGVGL